MDDGTRALPNELKGVDNDQLAALERTYSNTHRTNNTPEAIEKKRLAAEQMDAYARAFGTPSMGPTTDAPPPDHDFTLLVGDTVKLGPNPLGYFAGVGYERDFRFYDDGFRGRYVPASTDDPTVQRTNSVFADTRSLTTAQWSGLVNLAYRMAEHHELAFNFLYSQVGEDEARQLVGRILTSGEDQFSNTNRLTYLNSLYYTERNLTSYQLKGQHEFPALHDLRVDWLGALGSTYQDEPDLRYFNLIAEDSATQPLPVLEVNQNYTPEPQYPTRYFRHLEDDSLNGKLDFTLPFADRRELEWKVKSGLFTSRSERAYEERTFSYEGGSGTSYDPLEFPADYLVIAPPPQAITNSAGRVNYQVSRALNSEFGNSFYDGQQDINAAYGMMEIPLLAPLRLVGGARYEATFLEILSTQARAEPSSSLIDQGDLLPAVNLAWTLRPQMYLRASYAETVARPTYREFADNRSYDQFTGIIVAGNPLLTMSAIRNYDLRWEWFTDQGGLLSLGGFYKEVDAPIERINGEVDPDGDLALGGNVLTFVNGPPATVWGVELEARQSLKVIDPLLAPFSLGVNFAWINSQVDNLPELAAKKRENGMSEDVVSRPLYDQSPYIINADITYAHPRSGTSVTLAYNYAAERLSLITEAYDVYEQGVPSLDFVISQRLGKGWKLKFSAENLLNPEIIESYAVAGHTDTTYRFSSYTRGITFGLSLGYSY
jgi:TonB-dependent receptor